MPAQLSHFTYKPDGLVYVDVHTELTQEEYRYLDNAVEEQQEELELEEQHEELEEESQHEELEEEEEQEELEEEELEEESQQLKGAHLL